MQSPFRINDTLYLQIGHEEKSEQEGYLSHASFLYFTKIKKLN